MGISKPEPQKIYVNVILQGIPVQTNQINQENQKREIDDSSPAPIRGIVNEIYNNPEFNDEIDRIILKPQEQDKQSSIDNIKYNEEINNNEPFNNYSIFNNKNNLKEDTEKNKQEGNPPKDSVKSGTIFGEEEEEKENDNKSQTPYEKKEEKIPKINKEENKDKDNQDDDLELSQSVILLNENPLEKAKILMEKGYLPLFMKLNNYKARLFVIKKASVLLSLLKVYISLCPETNEGLEQEIELYNKGEHLDINKPIEEFDLEPFSKITNIESYEKLNCN